RLIDTILGSAIALVFGYLIWPKSIQNATKQNFAKVLSALADYMRSAFKNTAPEEMIEKSAVLRSFAYRQLSDMHTRLQKTLPEPPPTSTQALAWLPAITGAESLCDRITQLINLCEEKLMQPSQDAIELL